MAPGIRIDEQESILSLPVEAQAPEAGRTVRRIGRIIASTFLVAVLALGVLISILPESHESALIECFELKFDEGIAGSARPEWSSWPPGWVCVFDPKEGPTQTRYIGF